MMCGVAYGKCNKLNIQDTKKNIPAIFFLFLFQKDIITVDCNLQIHQVNSPGKLLNISYQTIA